MSPSLTVPREVALDGTAEDDMNIFVVFHTTILLFLTGLTETSVLVILLPTTGWEMRLVCALLAAFLLNRGLPSQEGGPELVWVGEIPKLEPGW